MKALMTEPKEFSLDSVGEEEVDLTEEEIAEAMAAAAPEWVRELQWQLSARPSQIPPQTGWTTLIARFGRGGGKRLAVETPIITPQGFIPIGDLEIGDTVYDENGKPCKVTFVSPIEVKPAYKVTFSDNSVLYADPEHQWVTWTHRDRKQFYRKQKKSTGIPKNWADKDPITTQGILDTFRHSGRKDLNHSIFLTKPLEGSKEALPLPAYVLGAWLGDGANKTAEIANMDIEVRDKIEALGVETKTINQRPGKCPRFTFGKLKINGRREYDTTTILKDLNLLKNKHIPSKYLLASKEDRLELLKGLMDTDGGYEKGNCRVSYITTDLQLAKDVHYLVCSLGMKPTLKKKQGKLYGVNKKMAYRVSFPALMQVFSLTRKAELLNLNAAQSSRNTHRMITKIEPVGEMPMRCISVDSPNSIYLAGESLIPTHNTKMAAEWVRRKIEIEGCRSGLIVGSTTAKVVDVMVEGPSGILACCPDAVYKANKSQVVWPNGSRVYIQTAEKKEGARGYSVEFVWADEFCEWKYERETWGNIIAAVREVGDDGESTSQKMITTTPKRTTLLREIEDKEGVIVKTGSTYDNRENLTKEYLQALEDNWAGTSLYRQEVLGEYLDQVEGALWQEDWILHGMHPGVDFDKMVVSVDPAMSVSRTSDETGIMVLGRLGNEVFLLEDLSGKHTPNTWARLCIDRAQFYGCEIVVEKNQGGDSLKTIIHDRDPNARVKFINAINSKEDRLGSAAIYYEKGQVTHVNTVLDENGEENIDNDKFKILETQMVSWVPPSPGQPQKESPDRADALSHGIRYLMGKKHAINRIAKPKVRIINLRNTQQRRSIGDDDTLTLPSNFTQSPRRRR